MFSRIVIILQGYLEMQCNLSHSDGKFLEEVCAFITLVLEHFVGLICNSVYVALLGLH